MAQYPYGPYGPYNPYGGGYYPGAVGGALQGQAAVINAQGEYNIQTQKAYQEQQKAYQAKIETKRKSFDEMMYEKANKATLTEDLSYTEQLRLQRMMTSPMPAEITSGQTLNAMMPMIIKLSMKGTSGPPVSIDQDELRHVNTTIAQTGANLGMLMGGGSNLNWPLPLRGPKQQKIAKELPAAVAKTKAGTLDQKEYRNLTVQLAALNEDLRTQFHKEEIDGGEFLEAQRFLGSLTQSVKALTQPTSQRFLDGSYAATGRTVPELAANMTKNGTTFTACNPGEEAVYYDLHNRFVYYTQAAESAAGYHVQYQPPRTAAYQNLGKGK